MVRDMSPSPARTCNRYTAERKPCTNLTTNRDGWCQRCAGLTSPHQAASVSAQIDARLAGAAFETPAAPVAQGRTFDFADAAAARAARLRGPAVEVAGDHRGSDFADRTIDAVTQMSRFDRSRFTRATIGGTHLLSSFRQIDASDANFGVGQNFAGCDFAESEMTGVNAYRVGFRNCRFDGATMRVGVWRACDFGGANLAGADLAGSDFAGSTYNDATVFPDGYDPDAEGWIAEPAGGGRTWAEASTIAMLEEAAEGRFSPLRDRSERIRELMAG